SDRRSGSVIAYAAWRRLAGKRGGDEPDEQDLRADLRPVDGADGSGGLPRAPPPRARPGGRRRARDRGRDGKQPPVLRAGRDLADDQRARSADAEAPGEE